jgi:hypothetical protein
MACYQHNDSNIDRSCKDSLLERKGLSKWKRISSLFKMARLQNAVEKAIG